MTLHNASTNPTEPGWYVVHERGRNNPLLLWWSHASRDWRNGAQRVPASHWVGPIPTPKTEPML